jgi:hypothetical protein
MGEFKNEPIAYFTIRSYFSIVFLCLFSLIAIGSGIAAENEPLWIQKIRPDHPRLFLNQEQWPSIRDRALNEENDWYKKMKERVDRYPDEPTSESERDDYAYQPTTEGDYERITLPRPKEWGPQAMETAFVYLMTRENKYLEKAKKMLTVSVSAYHDCYEKGMNVNWYSSSRVCTLAAYDWIYNDLSPDQRRAIIEPLLRHIEKVQPGQGKKRIYRLNGSNHTTGFYGVRNLVWFAGLAAYNDGFDDQTALQFLKQGYDHNINMFEYRKKCAGDDGGLASATVGYAMGAYPWAQFNFLHTWQSATGEQIASQWPHLAYYPVWINWNWIPHNAPREYGTGDTYHYTNELPLHYMYTHMSQVMHFYGNSYPDCAAQAAYIRENLPDSVKRYSRSFSFYPFLLTNLEDAPVPKNPTDADLHARHFETLGQIFMRSGTGKNDTYSLFTIGSRVPSHKQHDENNFVIYKKGYLALDSGTRGRETGYQLRHYYSQTVAHNCILVHMPGEPFPGYWGMVYPGEEGKISCGGTYRTTGGECVAFETNQHYTYVAGDVTPCYREEKCAQVLRQYLFIMPDYFVICDRVQSVKPEYKKDWLLHTQNEPTIEGQMFFADEGEGRLFCKTLYPQNANLHKIGGPGKEFYTCGRNWDVAPEVKERWSEKALWGHWRMEVSPNTSKKDDIFLHLIQVGDQTQTSMVESILVENDDSVGVQFEATNKTITATFSKQGTPSGHIKISRGDTTIIDRDLTQTVQPQSGLSGQTQ